MYINLPATATLEEIDAAIQALPEIEDTRALGVRFPDGSYRVVGEIVRYDECPREDFEQAMDILAHFYDR